MQKQHSPVTRGKCRKKAAVFVDRDGTLNEMVYDETHGVLDSPRRPGQVVARPHAAEFLAGVRRLGYSVVVVTNQPGLAKGTLTEKDLESVNRELARQLRSENPAARWDDMRICPHHPEGGPFARNRWVMECACRKPKPGLILETAREHGLDLKKSWVVGDGLNDIQAGRAAGCRTVLVTSLKIEQIERFFGRGAVAPDFIVRDLREALRVIRKGGKA